MILTASLTTTTNKYFVGRQAPAYCVGLIARLSNKSILACFRNNLFAVMVSNVDLHLPIFYFMNPKHHRDWLAKPQTLEVV